MEKKLEQLDEWFEKQIAFCAEEQRKLLDDDRTDEANFEKIRANVYDIFRTILSVAVKIGKGDTDAIKEFFHKKTEQIPAKWVSSYDKAKAHGEIEQMQIENIKLETIQEIKLKFSEIWEEKR